MYRLRIASGVLATLLVSSGLALAATTPAAEAGQRRGETTHLVASRVKACGSTRPKVRPACSKKQKRCNRHSKPHGCVMPVATRPKPVTTTVRPATLVAVPNDGAQLRQQFPTSIVGDGAFFPIAVWFESVLEVGNIESDRDAGLNTYLQLTEDSDLQLIKQHGMRAVASPRAGGRPLADGILLPDEVDMWAGAGRNAWTGAQFWAAESCEPAGSGCGYTVLDTFLREHVSTPTLRYGQFGKGVAFWQSKEQASVFVNEYSDVVSADTYWMTDPNICGRWEGGLLLGVDHQVADDECRRPSNYGETVRKVKSLVSPAGSKPVWVFVEIGSPFWGAEALVMPPESIRKAVWSGLANGANGVAYFNHSFGGACQSHHLLRDRCGSDARTAVKGVNSEIARFAPILNGESVSGYVRVASGDADVLVKRAAGRLYVIVAPGGADASSSVALQASCGPRQYSARDMMSGKSRVVSDGRVNIDFDKSDAVAILEMADLRGCTIKG